MGSVVQNSTQALRGLAEPRQPFKSMQRKLANVEIAISSTEANEQGGKKTRPPELLGVLLIYFLYGF